MGIFNKLKAVISKDIAKVRLQKLGLTKNDSDALIPIAIELHKLWEETKHERKLLTPAVQNILSKSQRHIVNILDIIQENEELQHILIPIAFKLCKNLANMLNESSSGIDESNQDY